MKRIGGMNIIENRTDVIESVAKWNEDWNDDADEMAINAAILAWASSVTDTEFKSVMGRPALGLNRMTIQNTLRMKGVIK